ncbi:hypothetical protein JCM7686_2649 [Paracoccus aminophilus JCM 7686]|uniref:Uncharacterized protein n=1 Tax=Paracoccus aminophilus JCM 7686 TaxID=1367847 RepID=S5Y1V2_PARAH|nr:hypothetical protein JCM7686_2649 [Paracoccus aminophilus JCM 7686]
MTRDDEGSYCILGRLRSSRAPRTLSLYCSSHTLLSFRPRTLSCFQARVKAPALPDKTPQSAHRKTKLVCGVFHFSEEANFLVHAPIVSVILHTMQDETSHSLAMLHTDTRQYGCE